MADPSTVSVVIPAYEESAAVGTVVQSLRAAANWREILVIDDGSADGTASAAAAAGARVVRHPYNKGNGASVKTGIRNALGDYVLIVDADGQHSASDALRLVSFLGEYDLVVGARAGSNQQASTARHVGNTCAELDSGVPDRPRDSRSHVGFTSRADERPPRVPSPAAQRILDADHHHAVVREGRL